MTRDRLDLVAPDEPDVERIWRSLEAVAQPSYFLSWGWISTWLATHAPADRPALAVMHDGREVSAAFFLAQRRIRRSLFTKANALYVNEPAIAHNGMLALPTARRSLAHLLDHLPTDWDELHLPALDRNAFDLSGDRYAIELEREELRYFVDLRRPHPTTTAMIDAIVEPAATRTAALALYDRMNVNDAFDRRLITDRFDTGEIQLLHITRAGHTLGSLFNLVHGDRVVTYRTNLVDARTSLAAAIVHNAAAGHRTYELPGELPDETLATGADRLVWLSVTRPYAWVSALREHLDAKRSSLPLVACLPA